MWSAASGQAATGEIIQLNGVDCYISKPTDYPHVSAKLLLLLTGGTGIKSTNNQIQADMFASNGFLVVMPDLFDGDPAPNMKTDEQDDVPLIEKIKMRVADTAKSFLIDMWLARHTEDKVLPILHKIIKGCNEKFQNAVNNGFYGVGYCFGGRYILHLASDREIHSSWGHPDSQDVATNAIKGPVLKAGSLAHATQVSPDDFVGLKAPVSLVCVEDDVLFPAETRTAGEDYMNKNNIEHEVQVYPSVPHGRWSIFFTPGQRFPY